MLPFFARTLTRREMALGCAVLSLALLLSALPAALRWGQAQLDTGALLCADTLRFHIRADSDSPADKTVKQQPVKKIKIGANDPCPCGSGKKYKYCCRDKDEAKS